MQRQHQASSAAASRPSASGRIVSETRSIRPFDSTTSTIAADLPAGSADPRRRPWRAWHLLARCILNDADWHQRRR